MAINLFITAQQNQPRLILDPDGHKARVLKVAFTNDEKYLLSCSQDKSVKMWEIATGNCVKTFRGFIGDGDEGMIYCIALSPDDRYLAVGGYMDGDTYKNESYEPVRIYDFQSGKMIKLLKGHISVIANLEFSHDGKYLASSSQDAKVIIWDVKNNFKLLHTLTYHKQKVRGISFSPGNKYIATASEDRSIALWDLKSGKLVISLALAHNEEIVRIEYSTDGKYLATSSYDGSVRLWNANNLKLIRTINQVNKDYVNYYTQEIKFSPDGKYIVFGGSYFQEHNGQWIFPIYYYNLKNNTIEKTIWQHNNTINSIAFSTSSQYLAAAGGNENDIYIYDNNSLKVKHKLISQGKAVFSIAFGNDGKSIYFGNSNESAYPNQYGSIEKSFSLLDFTINNNPDNNYTRVIDNVKGKTFIFYPGYNNRSIQIGTNTFTTADNYDIIRSYSFTPNGKYAVVGSDYYLTKIDAGTGSVIGNFTGHNGAIWSVTVDANGKYLASGSNDQTIALWDIASLKAQNKTLEFKVAHVYPGSIAEKYGLKKHDIIYQVDNKTFTTQEEFLYYISAKRKYTFYIRRNNKNIQLIINKTADSFGFMFDRILNSVPPVATIFIANNGEYLIWTADNYFTGNKRLFKYVGWHINQGEDKEAKFYPFEQFDLKYNRPDIVLKRLGFVDEKLIDMYYELYQKRLKKMGFREQDLSGDLHLPEVKINSDIKTGSTSNSKATLEIKAMDSLYKLDRINIYINDVPIHGLDGISIKNKKIKSYSFNTNLNLAYGRNKIQVSCLNEKGVESYKETINIYCNKKYTKPDLYLVTMGVSKYKDSQYNLVYADKDAEDLIAAYKKNQAYYNKINILNLNNEKATRKNIQGIKDFFDKSKIDDHVILFIAGHGMRDNRNQYYFCTHDIDFYNPQKNGYDFDELDSLLDGIPALNKLLLMDTCFSGEAEEDDYGVELTFADDNGKVKSRGLKVKQAKTDTGDIDKKELILLKKDIFANLKNGTGAMVITSSSGAEYSYEGVDIDGNEIENGVFTHALISGLNNYQSDVNKDKQIQVSEIMNWVYDNVIKLTGGLQNPTMRREKIEFDCVIY